MEWYDYVINFFVAIFWAYLFVSYMTVGKPRLPLTNSEIVGIANFWLNLITVGLLSVIILLLVVEMK